MLAEYDFGIEAVPYLDSQLLRGKTLAHYVLQNQTLEKGRIVAYLPPNIPFEKRVRFLAGGIMSSPRRWETTIDFINVFLNKPSRRYAVFEDAYAKSNDAWIEEAKNEFLFFFKSEVYHALRSQDQDKERIIRTLKAAHTYPCIILLTSLPENQPDIENRQHVTKAILENLAKRVEHILIGAYDNETEVIWSRIV